MQLMQKPNVAAMRAAGRSGRVVRPRIARTQAAAVEAASETSTSGRVEMVQKSFPGAMDNYSWMAKIETALEENGFTGANSIAVTNLCRDEATAFLRDTIDNAFGSSFNVMGLGGVLTCGCTGFGAGFSHSPVCPEGRERYVFFSLPHIAISEAGEIGKMARPGRPAMSAACGAMLKLLGEMKAEGVTRALTGGLYDTSDPEYSILKNRVVSQAVQDGKLPADLVQMTLLAEKAITGDLEWLISKTVDTSKADYAVFTGVQIHNWADDLNDPKRESYEFVFPTKGYAVVNGERKEINLASVKASADAKNKFEANITPVDKSYFMPRLIGNYQTKPGTGSVTASPAASSNGASAPATPKAGANVGFMASLEKMFK